MLNSSPASASCYNANAGSSAERGDVAGGSLSLAQMFLLQRGEEIIRALAVELLLLSLLCYSVSFKTIGGLLTQKKTAKKVLTRVRVSPCIASD